MCTAITFHAKNDYFGRNLDYDISFGEQVVITPRNFALHFRREGVLNEHYAMIGMAVIDNDYPLYFDATNEWGLSMAGLNFPDNAIYLPPTEGKDNITPFEFIPWILGRCQTIQQAIPLLERLNVTDIAYSDQYPLTPLHWLIADKTDSLTLEPTADGLKIYNNPIGVLTNNPPFDFHTHNLANYLNLTADEPVNRFSANNEIRPYSRGMGAIGLPGDLSSASRFVRAAFTKLNSVCDQNDTSEISQFFHILDSVVQQKGCVKFGNSYEKTLYTSCCNTNTGDYYYTTYENRQITRISLKKCDLDGEKLYQYPLINNQQIRRGN